MARDPFYRSLFDAKKDYYLHQRGMAKYIEDPKGCPQYEACRRRLVGRAARLGREPKKFPCKMHANSMAVRWMARMILSHVLEIYREAEGLPTENFKEHSNYCPPKPEDFNPQDKWFQRVLEGIRRGVCLSKPKRELRAKRRKPRAS